MHMYIHMLFDILILEFLFLVNDLIFYMLFNNILAEYIKSILCCNGYKS